MSLRQYIQGQFGLDRRDSAIRKAGVGIMYELENMMVDEGSAYTRPGFIRQFITALEVNKKVLALHRYIGTDANTGEEIREFYAAISNLLKKYYVLPPATTPAWHNMILPPGITLSMDKLDPTQGQKGIFRQLRDRTYYSNYTEPVLMIKKENNQVYEAGIPEPDRELVINTCETLTVSSIQVNGNAPTGWDDGEWTIFTDGDTDDITCQLDYAFDHHTKGDYGILMQQSGEGKTMRAIYKMPSIMDLEWFFTTQSGTADAGSGGDILVDTAAPFTSAQIIGQQIKNISDDSLAVVEEIINSSTIKTSVLSGGSNNAWANGNQYKIGEPSSELDYIAIDIFRYTKIDIDELLIEFSSVAPDNNGLFSKGFRCVLYSDTDWTHFSIKQRTMLAEWAMNPYSNRLFLAKFRKSWFIHLDDTNIDDWSQIKYMKIHLMQNADSSLKAAARIVVDNVRLLKTPPVPGELMIQVATCDGLELWTNATNDIWRATKGISCKAILSGQTAIYGFGGAVKDLSEYAEGTPVNGSDVFIFDVCGTGTEVTLNLETTITLIDNAGKTAIGIFTAAQNFAEMQTRSIHIQEFQEQDGFDWSIVKWLWVTPALSYTTLYIDNIRIQPPSASKVINRFVPLDLILAQAIEEGIDHFFGDNQVVDAFTDYIFHAWATFSRQATGQGSFVYPEYQHGRYKFGDFAAPSLQITADPGGAFSMSFLQNTDLTEYESMNFNLDAFFHPREYNDKYFLGTDWVEVPATDSDEFSIWISSPDWSAINKLIFRFYVNQNADWTASTAQASATLGSDVKILIAAGGTVDFRTKLGHRIKNETTGKWGIIGWVGNYANRNKCSAWGVTWSANDIFTVGGFGFGAAGSRPIPDADDYYEYEIDLRAYVAKLGRLLNKETRKQLQKYSVENQEIIEGLREILEQDGITTIAKVKEGSKGWWSAVLSWKRSDMIHHNKSQKPFSSMQCIASHQITVQASSKKAATINFQDWIMRKKGAVNGEVAYKIKLMDDQGYLGPASLSTEVLTTTGNDIQLADIYVPYDTRMVRKEIYRSDSNGVYRYLDTIDRKERSYLDQIPEDLLGAPIAEDLYRPPRSKIMEKAINRMAYANIVDRDERIRKSRIQLAKPFAPHQCSDDETFDVLPEDGQEITGFRWYNGIYIVWKEKSLFTVDPDTFEYIPREHTFGCIAPHSIYEIPGEGFGWLSHEGPIFGDHTNFDKFTGRLIWDDLQSLSLETLRKAVGFFYDDYYYLFVGSYNQYGYALHVPTKSWFYLTNWNVQCVNLWNSGSDNREVYAGSNYGYVNQLFQGNTDITDNAISTYQHISWAIRTVDYDFGVPMNYKWPRWVLLHAKNLVSGAGNECQIIITPQLDQVAGSAYSTLIPNRTTYYQYRVDGRSPTIGGEKGTLLAMRLAGIKRCAIRDILIEAGDFGFRPNLC